MNGHGKASAQKVLCRVAAVESIGLFHGFRFRAALGSARTSRGILTPFTYPVTRLRQVRGHGIDTGWVGVCQKNSIQVDGCFGGVMFAEFPTVYSVIPNSGVLAWH